VLGAKPFEHPSTVPPPNRRAPPAAASPFLPVKLWHLVLVLCSVAVVGCGSSSGGDTQTQQQEAAVTTTAETTPEPAATTETTADDTAPKGCEDRGKLSEVVAGGIDCEVALTTAEEAADSEDCQSAGTCEPVVDDEHGEKHPLECNVVRGEAGRDFVCERVISPTDTTHTLSFKVRE
jgi:hypothetical protein